MIDQYDNFKWYCLLMKPNIYHKVSIQKIFDEYIESKNK